MTTAVELVRVSGHDQVERDTAAAQRRALDELRARRPAEIIARIDPPHAVSASLPLAQRTDLAELRTLAERGFDELRCFDLSRLSRAEDPVDRMAVLSIVASAGAIIVDCAGREMDPRTDEGELTYFVGTLFARAERRRFVARSSAGKHARAAAGHVVARLGFGYRALPRSSRKDPPTYELDPVQAPIVEWIYAQAVAGVGLRSIARAMEARGVPAPRGGTRWSASRMLMLVRSSTYRGQFTQTVDGVKYVAEVPRIVSDETWYEAQEGITERCQNRGRPGTVPALIRGRAYCGACGCSIAVHTQARGRGHGPRYVCSSQRSDRRAPSCGSSSHLVSTVDEAVWKALREVVAQPELLTEAVADQQLPAWHEQIAQCNATLTRAVRDERRVLDLMRRDLLSDEVASGELRRIRTLRETAERSRELAERAIAHRERHTRASSDIVETYRPLLDAADLATQRNLLEAVVPEGRPYGAWLNADGSVEIVGVLAAAPASGGAGGVGRSDPSACSKVKPLE